MVRHTLGGRKIAQHILWYVGGKAYRSLPLTQENIKLTAEWREAGKTPA